MATKKSIEYADKAKDTTHFKADQIWNEWRFGLTPEQQLITRQNMHLSDLPKEAEIVFGEKIDINGDRFKGFKEFRLKVQKKGGRCNFTDADLELIQNNAEHMSLSELLENIQIDDEHPTKIKSDIRLMCNVWGITPPGTEEEENTVGDYTPIRSQSTLIGRINAVDSSADISVRNKDTYTSKIQECLSVLIQNMNSPRFVMLVGALKRKDLRRLFEDEFIKATWRKPELDTEDVNGYISLSHLYVKEYQLTQQMDSINEEINNYDPKVDTGLSKKDLYSIKKNLADELSGLQSEMAKERVRLSGSRDKKIAQNFAKGDRIGKFILLSQTEGYRKYLKEIEAKVQEGLEDKVKQITNWEEEVIRVDGITPKELFDFRY